MSRPQGEARTLGVAIRIPEPFGAELDGVRARYCPDDGDMPAHVTILAPVDVDVDLMEGVLDHLGRVAEDTQPFRLVLRGTGTFRPVSPVVFVTVAEGISACEQLEGRVRSGDLAVETRFPYHPHVTIAHDVDAESLDRALDELAGFTAEMTIDAMSLHENVKGRWRQIREFAFARS